MSGLCLAFTVAFAPSAQAEAELAQPESIAEVALHQPDSGIRLRLHGVEDLREPRLPRARGTTLSADQASLQSGPLQPEAVSPALAEDEIKKQAQTKYLAAKLKEEETTVRKYVDLAWAEAYRRDWLKPELLIAIIHKESSFRPRVQSRYGAQGLMQVVRRWHKDKLRPSESLFDPEVNIRVGADVLEEYLELANGNLDHALRKYSGNARNYANIIKKESSNLARVAERAARQSLVARG